MKERSPFRVSQVIMAWGARAVRWECALCPKTRGTYRFSTWTRALTAQRGAPLPDPWQQAHTAMRRHIHKHHATEECPCPDH